MLVPFPNLLVALPTGPSGSFALSATWPAGVPAGLSIFLQAWVPDPAGVFGFAATNALQGTTP